MTPTPSPRYRMALVAAGLFAGLVLAEVGLRFAVPDRRGTSGEEVAIVLSRPSQPRVDGSVTLAELLRPSSDRDRVYELRPGLDCIFRGAKVVTNRYGMRDRELSPAKPPDVVRVVGLGDSVMFGWGVEAGDSYLRVAERMIAAETWPVGTVRLLNFGVPGYNTAMQAALLRGLAARFEPDALVIHFVNNDLELPRFMLEPLNRWSPDRLWLVDLVRGGWRGFGERGGWVSPREVAEMGRNRGRRVRAKYAHLAGEGPFRQAMTEIAECARSRSIPVVFMALQADGEPWATGVGTAEALGFRVVVAGPRFLEYLSDRGRSADREGWRRTFSVAPNDPHPNEVGHRIYAELLVEALEEELKIKG